MPEIKNTFTSGKMNKDLDERLVPNGQYRDAMNIEVASSDSDTVGALTNSKGNAAMNSTGIAGATCVGSVVDSENDRIIWFISGTSVDAIVEYDLVSSDISPILVDSYKNTSPVLGFSSDNYITGINILNGILFWTDNVGEPKKINIETMKNGLVDTIDGKPITQVSNGGFKNPVTEWTATDPPNTDLTAGHVQFSGAQSANISIYQNISGLANGENVKVTFEVGVYAFGQVRVRLPGAVGAWITPTANSSHTVTLSGNTGNEFHIEVDSDGSMIIDDVIMTKDTFSVTDQNVFGGSLGDIFSTTPSVAGDIKVFVNDVEDTSFTYANPNVTLSSVPSLTSDIRIELASKSAIFAQKTFYIINGFNRNIPRLRDITVARRFPLNAPSVSLYDNIRDGIVSNVPVYTIPENPSPNPSGIIIPNYRFWLYKDANGTILTKPPGVNTTNPFYQNGVKLVDENGDEDYRRISPERAIFEEVEDDVFLEKSSVKGHVERMTISDLQRISHETFDKDQLEKFKNVPPKDRDTEVEQLGLTTDFWLTKGGIGPLFSKFEGDVGKSISSVDSSNEGLMECWSSDVIDFFSNNSKHRPQKFPQKLGQLLKLAESQKKVCVLNEKQQDKS